MPGFDGVTSLLPNSVVPTYSGMYTPTVVSVSGLTSIVAQSTLYLRVLDVVFVSGYFTATPSGQITAGISLPVASNLATANDLSGVGSFPSSTAASGGTIAGDTTNKRANYVQSTAAGGTTFRFMFMYRVI